MQEKIAEYEAGARPISNGFPASESGMYEIAGGCSQVIPDFFEGV
jgi:hypothetical protein